MNPEGEVVPYLTAGLLIMYTMRWMKHFDWYCRFVQVFPTADRHVHRIVAGVGALIAALGIHYTFQGDGASGWQVAISIPNLTELGHGAWDFVNVYILQQASYEITRRPEVVPAATSVNRKP